MASLDQHTALMGNTLDSLPKLNVSMMLQDLLRLFSPANVRKQSNYLVIDLATVKDSPQVPSTLQSCPSLKLAIRRQIQMTLEAAPNQPWAKPLPHDYIYQPESVYICYYDSTSPGMSMHGDALMDKMWPNNSMRSISKYGLISGSLNGTIYQPLGGMIQVSTEVEPGDVVAVASNSQCAGLAVMVHGGRAINPNTTPTSSSSVGTSTLPESKHHRMSGEMPERVPGGQFTIVCDVVPEHRLSKEALHLDQLFQWRNPLNSVNITTESTHNVLPSPCELMEKVNTLPSYSHMKYSNINKIKLTSRQWLDSLNGKRSIKKQKATPAPQGSSFSNMLQHNSSKGGKKGCKPHVLEGRVKI